MGRVQTDIHIEAPIELVWDIRTDPKQIGSWLGDVAEVKDASGKLDRTGATCKLIHKSDSPLRSTSMTLWQVIRAEKPRLLEIFAIDSYGMAGVKTTIRFEPSGYGTDLHVEVDAPRPGGSTAVVGGYSLIEAAALAALVVGDKVSADSGLEEGTRYELQYFKRLCETTFHSAESR